MKCSTAIREILRKNEDTLGYRSLIVEKCILKDLTTILEDTLGYTVTTRYIDDTHIYIYINKGE